VRAQQADVKAFGLGALVLLFGLQHKVAAPVQIDPARAGAAVGVLEGDGALEHVVLFGRWEGALHFW
jgi:hypothetical protein